MKKIYLKRVIIYVLFLLINCNFTFNLFSQNVAVTDDDLYTAEASAMLDINSTTKGLLIPRLTTVQREAINPAAVGLLVFDSNKNAFYYYNGEEWLALPQVSISTGVSDALFAVKNSAGDTIFAVYNDGVKVVVPYGTKGKVGGFAVSGRSPTKAGEEEYLLVTPDSTRIFVNEVDVKGSVGGFAVSGRSPTKTSTYNYFLTNSDSTRVYIDTISTKGSVGGFAVSGRSPTKAGTVKFMDMTPKNYLIGQEAGKSLTTGSYNSYIGYQAGKSTQSGSKNIFIGYQSGYNNIGGTGDLGSYNVYLGYKAGYSNTTGWGNTGIGYLSLYSNTIGYNNVANGYGALYTNFNGNFNVANGYQALYLNYAGAYNVANGHQALYKNTNGNYNNAYGYMALYSNTTGQDNTAVGYQAMYYNTTAQQNVAIGKEALFNANTNYNVAVGNSALHSNTTGSYNTALGFSAFYSGTAYVNSTALGYGTAITANTQVRVGNAGITSIGGYVGWTTLPSDKRFKKNIVENVPGLAFILKLRPVTYNIDIDAIANFLHTPDNTRINDLDTFKGNMLQTGFVAQEVESAANEIGFDFCGIDKPKNKNDFYGIRYAEFTVPLVKAVQELNYKIETQQLQIELTSAENLNLKNELQSIKSELETIKTELKTKK